jgi:hypothetical protein
MNLPFQCYRITFFQASLHMHSATRNSEQIPLNSLVFSAGIKEEMEKYIWYSIKSITFMESNMPGRYKFRNYIKKI